MVWLYDEENLGIDSGIQGGALVNPPAPDNYWGAPSESPRTPQGNGTGYFVDSSQESALWGAIDKAINYAILRDTREFEAQQGVVRTGGQIVPTAQQAQSMANSQLLLIGVAGLIVYLIAKA